MDNRCDRRTFLQRASWLCGAAPLARLPAQAQSAGVRRVGFIIGGARSLIDAFKDALRRLGHIEGQSLFLDLRIASGAKAATQAAELARSGLELVVAGS